MKRTAIALALGVVLAEPSSAAGRSCVDPWSAEAWWGDFEALADGVPVDAELWLYVPWDTTTSGCSLVAQDHTVSLVLEATGDAGRSYLDFLIRLIPAEQLLPAHVYRLECEALAEDDYGYSVVAADRVIEVRTRADAAPASPPEEVIVTEVRRVRTDTSLCGCGDDDVIELALGGLDEGYLREGGRIEASDADGLVFPVSVMTERAGGKHHLPYTLGPLSLTPVAADGTRGATVTIEPDEIDDPGVYIPCRSSLAGPSRALWWLVPVLWIGARRRRRTG